MTFGNHEAGDVDKLIKYLKALEMLHKKEPDALSAILTVINYESDSEGSDEIKKFNVLAKHMLTDESVHREVVRVAKKLIQNPGVSAEFLKILNEK